MSLSDEDDILEGFHDLPSEKEREAMSVLRLAELMATREKGSPPYIVLAHELTLKIAKLQTKATLRSGWLGVGGTVFTALATFALGYFVGTSSPHEAKGLNEHPSATQQHNQIKSGEVKPIPPRPSTQGLPAKSPNIEPAAKMTKQEHVKTKTQP